MTRLGNTQLCVFIMTSHYNDALCAKKQTICHLFQFSKTWKCNNDKNVPNLNSMPKHSNIII